MRTVHKYPIGYGPTVVNTGAHAIFRHFDQQDGNLFVWLELDTEEVKRDHHFCIFGTGHSIPQGADYRGTVLQGVFVWHLYEVY